MIAGPILSRMLGKIRSKTHFEIPMRPEETLPKDEDLRHRTDMFIDALRRGEYDFVDLGTCDGGGFTIAERQGGRNGLGFDLEPSTVRRALADGLDVALYDVCKLEADGPRVDFAVCSHILEHLPSLAHIKHLLRTLRELSRDYLLISGPVFDDEEYLLQFGIKDLNSLMLDHTCKMTMIQFQSILYSIACRDYLIALSDSMEDSSNIRLYDALQPVPATGLRAYDAEQHLPKREVRFKRKLHRSFVCVVPLRAEISCDAVLERFSWGFEKVVIRSSWYY